MIIFADREQEALTLLHTVCQAKTYAVNAWESGKNELEELQRRKFVKAVRIDSVKKQMPKLEADVESACLSLRMFLHSDTVDLIKSNSNFWQAQFIVCYPGTNDVLLRVDGNGKLKRESQETQNEEFWSSFVDKMDSLLPTTASKAQLPIPKQYAPTRGQVPQESRDSLGNVWTSFIGKVKSVLPQHAGKVPIPIPNNVLLLAAIRCRRRTRMLLGRSAGILCMAIYHKSQGRGCNCASSSARRYQATARSVKSV